MILGTKRSTQLLMRPAYIKMRSAVNEAYLHPEPHLPCEAGEAVQGESVQGVLAAAGEAGCVP